MAAPGDTPAGGKRRLFVAVDLSPAAREALEAAIQPLRADFPKARWVPHDNWHVTVKFLGATAPDLVEGVGERLVQVAATLPSFEAELADVGTFPGERRARVLWAGLTDPHGQLAAVASALGEALSPEFPIEQRSFTAHVTVARFDPLVPLGPMLSSIRVPHVRFAVDRLVLYETHLRRSAPVYEAIREAPLGGNTEGA
jgi:2'-5' RNA ligase